jgi:hypothetical protein
MAKITLDERRLAALTFRIGAVHVNDIPTRRKIDRAWDALKLDDVSPETLGKLNNAAASWAPGTTELEITSELRDYLIEWLTPTERFAMNGYQGRILGPVYDELKEARDGTPTPEATS